jgi:HPt (histidine-containing phosphotransfer) domain-containing protein
MGAPKTVVLNVDDKEAEAYAVTRIPRRIGVRKTPQEAISRQNADAVPHQAHGLRGSCANHAAVALREDAHEVELAAERGDLVRASSLFGTPKQDFSGFRRVIGRERLER